MRSDLAVVTVSALKKLLDDGQKSTDAVRNKSCDLWFLRKKTAILKPTKFIRILSCKLIVSQQAARRSAHPTTQWQLNTTLYVPDLCID